MNEGGFCVQKIKEGDQMAFCSFVDVYSKDLYYFALGYVNVRELAEEVVSDVFLEVWNNRSRLDEITHIKSWLLVLVRNKSISYLRKEQTEQLVSFEEIGEFHVPLFQSPDHKMISKEETAKINQAIATLPPKCKEVFVLAKIEKLPYKKISEMLNISVKTINVHVAKALNIISRALTE